MQADTLPKLLLEKAAKYGRTKAALREKDRGIWQEVTWAEYLHQVKSLCLGFVSLGLERGDKVCIIGENRPEWVYTELAVQAAGGTSVGLYQDSLAKEIAYAIDHSDARFVVVEDQEQVDKLLEIRDQLPKVEKLIYYDPKGMRGYNDPWILYLPDVQALGAEHPDQAAFERMVAEGTEDDIAIICYTSGSTGSPKGAMLRHRNLISMGRNLAQVDPLTERDNYLSFLPLAWIGEQMMTFATALVVGCTVNFPEEPETTREDMRQIGPQVMFSPPRVWEEMLTRVQVKIEDSARLKQWLYEKLLPWGYRMADRHFKQEAPSAKERFMYGLADFLIFSAIRDHLGLQGLKRAYTGGAALGPDVFRFYHALGVNLKQIYGSTEIVGIAVLHRDGDIRFHTVGKPLEGQMRIEEGQILLKAGAVFAGYYKNDEASQQSLKEGWLHTGDAGYIDTGTGHLVVIDRLKDVMKLANGEIFSPQFIENKLKFSPYIKEAVCIGQDRTHVVAMINIDMSAAGKWAENHGVPYTTYTDLSQKEPILELIEREVERVNGALQEAARIRRFVILHKELDADDEEMTRTRKLRRGFINEKYAPVIEGLYREGVYRIPVRGKVRYRDGREAFIETELKVVVPEAGGLEPKEKLPLAAGGDD